MPKGEEWLCLVCENRWFRRVRGYSTQCNSCFSSFISTRKAWNNALKAVSQIATVDELKQFEQIVSVLREHGIVRSAREKANFSRLFSDIFRVEEE